MTTVNELILELETLRGQGLGDIEVLTQIDYYGGSGSYVYDADPPVIVIDIQNDLSDKVSLRLAGKKALLIG